MNYLAHLYLAGPSEAELVGALLGDFVKGRVPDRLDEGLRNGIVLHRKIDAFTDAHALTLVSRQRFSRGRRRFAGIIVDVVYDHFLARHWRRYSESSLSDFAGSVYRVLHANLHRFSGRGHRMVARMIGQDWLTGYHSLASIGDALDGVSARLQRPNALRGSLEEVRSSYAGLEADFLGFFPELDRFAQDTRAQLSPDSNVAPARKASAGSRGLAPMSSPGTTVETTYPEEG